ncbi:MAG: septal ring lytic transglycosylase RlpA family protein [Gammaproteobacteria bacterium]|nr:septal ring lytic transglycosylase RlpA family protein [Gammaproteobacteria bacterium]
MFFRDGGPHRAFNPDTVAEIEPKFEPLSPGGNPASYKVFGKQYKVLKSSAGFVQRGDASWYGTKFHGNKTSNGERYDMYAISAAHKSLPIPTYLEVTNLENGRKLIVRVNDRGPFHSGRIIDLSYAAAAKLGYAGKGTAPVEIRAIDVAQYQREKLRTTAVRSPNQVKVTPLPSSVVPVALKATPLPTVEYADKAEKIVPTVTSPSTSIEAKKIYIQLGAYSNRDNAEQMVKLTHQTEISTAETATIQPFTRNTQIIYRVRLGPYDSKAAADQILQHLIQNKVGEPRIFHDS